MNIIKKLLFQKQSDKKITEISNDEPHENDFSNTTDVNDDFIPPEYTQTIFLSLFKNKPHCKGDKFPEYVHYELNIINTELYFDEMISEEYLQPASTHDMLNMLKVSELKNILAMSGKKKTGNKPDLIIRILSEIDLSQLNILRKPYYSLSQKGKNFLCLHEDFIKIRSNSQWGIGIQEYIRMKDISNGTISFDNIILSLLNQKLMDIKKRRFDLSQYEYHRLHEIYLSLYQLLQDKEDFQNAIKPLLSSLLLSISGCENYWLIEYKRNLKLKNIEVLKRYVPVHINEFVAMDIIGLKDYYSEQVASDVYHGFIGPFNLCALEMFKEMTKKIFISTTTPDLSQYDEVIKKEFIKKLK